MKDKLEKLMKAKGGKEMHPIEKEAKMRSLGELHKQAQGMLGEKLQGLKKVTVAAPDKAGLKEGLAKAEDMVGSAPITGEEEPSEEGSPEEALAALQAMGEGEEEMPQSEEEIDAMIQELMAKKAELAAKK